MKKIIFLLILACSASGCSLVGLGIGALIDNGNSRDPGPIFSDIDNAKGQPATIQFHDSVSFATFIGYSEMLDDSYRTYYDSYLKTHPATSTSIHLGDTVVTQSLGFTGVFEGYGPGGIILSGKQYRFAKFDNIIAPNHISSTSLKSLCEANVLPIRATLNFQDKNATFSLTNRDFQNVMIESQKGGNAKWIGLGIGAAIDVTFLVIDLVTLYRYPFTGSFATSHYTGGKPQQAGLKFRF